MARGEREPEGNGGEQLPSGSLSPQAFRAGPPNITAQKDDCREASFTRHRMSSDSSTRAEGSGEPAGNCVLRCQQALLTPPSNHYLQPLTIPMPSQKQSLSDVRR